MPFVKIGFLGVGSLQKATLYMAKIAMHESRSTSDHFQGGKTRPKMAAQAKVVISADVHQADFFEKKPYNKHKLCRRTMDYSNNPVLQSITSAGQDFDSDYLTL